jgi:putative membrane protein
MVNLLIRLLVSAGAVMLAQWLFQQWNLILVDDWLHAFLFAIVLGILNALIRPVLLLLTCPINLLTFGLFVFVVNAVVFAIAAWLAPGIHVSGFIGALAGSLIVTICHAIANHLLERSEVNSL